MVEKLGFEKDRRIIQDHNNTWHYVTLCDTQYHVRSGLERDWVTYLNMLWESGEILCAEYEPHTFYFPNQTAGPVKYTPDFRVVEKDGTTVWQELKGYHDGKTNSRLQKMAKYFPDEIMELVLQNIPKKGSKGVNRRAAAARWTRRIIDASQIFRQCGIK